MAKQLRCCNCNKVIADEISIQMGVVKIACKCGTVNEVKAEQKNTVPYGERVVLQLKEEDMLDMDGEKRGTYNRFTGKRP